MARVHAAFDADTDCRLAAYRLVMTLLAPRIGPWERRRRVELATVRAAWRERVRTARRLPATIDVRR